MTLVCYKDIYILICYMKYTCIYIYKSSRNQSTINITGYWISKVLVYDDSAQLKIIHLKSLHNKQMHNEVVTNIYINSCCFKMTEFPSHPETLSMSNFNLQHRSICYYFAFFVVMHLVYIHVLGGGVVGVEGSRAIKFQLSISVQYKKTSYNKYTVYHYNMYNNTCTCS